MLRNKTCGELRKENEGEEVILCGWVSKIRNLGSLCFIDLRDTYGITQLNVEPSYFEANKVHNEYVLQVFGKVALRTSPNKDLGTGDIEIKVEKYKVLAEAKQTPFIIADKTDALEDTRLKWRYLDLRRPCLQHNLKVRDIALTAAREYMHQLGFFEIETPTLVKSTPEGARDYLVPSRTYPGNFYALPQSPQLYKQLLMVAGMDKYFQIARCYRDEDQRADRQPEFDQIDVEMSFVDREDVLKVIEGLMSHIFKVAANIELPKFARVTYSDAVNLYGTDKPDLRYGMLLHDVSYLSTSGFKAFEGKVIKALVLPNQASKSTRKEQEKDQQLSAKFRVPHLMFAKAVNNHLECSAFKFFSPESIQHLEEDLKAKDGDLVIIGADAKLENAAFALGALRVKYAQEMGLRDPHIYKPCFVIDWPLFAKTDTGYEALSNPFTSPIPEDMHLLYEAPEKIRSTSYDTVLNGEELSSGALRIYDKKVQWKVFEILGLTDEDIKQRFGFFVDAFDYGFPPEGGFGIGVERLMMELLGDENIKDVLAFPKNLMAAEPMSSCPSTVPNENLDILGIQLKEKTHE